MGTEPDARRARTFTGGITYGNVEALNIELGTGNDTLTIESTHAGRTTITSGRGGDTFYRRDDRRPHDAR